jgi:surface carbohydrate biosynthesis protein (TIGR04326 family)
VITQLTDTILIWDSEGSPPVGNFTNVLWRGFITTESTNTVSIPELIEKDSVALRSRYLSWIYELGEMQVGDRRLIDHLEIRSGFSYWWMTLIAEKCNWAKSPQITDAIRLFAFDKWANNSFPINSVKLVSANSELHECLEEWCKTRLINYDWQRQPENFQPNSLLTRVSSIFPHSIQALVWLLKYLIDRWPLRGVGVEELRNGVGQTTFVSYFFNLGPESAKNRSFESEYWTDLPNALSEKAKIHSNWLHLYKKSPIAPNAQSAAKLLRSFNENKKHRQVHVALDSFLSIKTAIYTIKDFFDLRKSGHLNIENIIQSRIHENVLLESWLWPLFKKDWDRSFFGIDAIRNLLMVNLFENAFSALPVQKIGIYLQENQEWEFAMIYAWRASSHKKLIGFPHSTVRYWDLRYFYDPRSYFDSHLSLPRPDHVAISGVLAQKAYEEGMYRLEELIEVEALRYLYLDRNMSKKKYPRLSEERVQILVLGDYLFSDTVHQMNLLQEVTSEITNIELTVKPHPACPIHASHFPRLNFKVTTQRLSDLVELFDVAYVSGLTSAAVDAYNSGLKVITVLNPRALNLSPLRGLSGVRFISTSLELRKALLDDHIDIDKFDERACGFNTDSSLPKWMSLISSCGQ